MFYCSFGNALRLTQDTVYREVLQCTTHSLASRYNPFTGCIKSWDSNPDKWQFPVIIDNMMNLEMLMWASKDSGDSTYMKMAVSHADKTLENHFREDFSSYHVVSYDTLTGKPHSHVTHQGYADESAWARGQAWALYGYTMMFRESGESAYLHQAQHVADFILNHPNLPEDKIPPGNHQQITIF